MDLLHYFSEIKQLKEVKNFKELDLLLIKIKKELQEIQNHKQSKLVLYQERCDYKIQRKKKDFPKINKY